MRRFPVVPTALVLALSACGPESPAEPATEAACPLIAPTRLAVAPEGFEPAGDAWYDVRAFGNDILFTFDRFDDPDRAYWRLNRCTGEIEPYPALTPGLQYPYVIDTPDGRILYGNDDAGRPYVIDRFDVPGDDEARPVPGLPDDVDFSPPYSAAFFARFFVFWTSHDSDELIFNAAGLGAPTYAVYTHLGDPEVPALRLSDRLVSAYWFDDTHSLIHEDSGEVHRISNLSGERELLRTGVRYLGHGFDGRTFIWQAIGDDAVEPVYLHDVHTGEDVQIASNDFAAMSWHRDEDRIGMGEWIHTRDPAAAAAAMLGPGDRFVAAVRLDTGEAVAVPPHLRQLGSFDGYFRLLLARDSGDAEALWDPRSGEVREWYRGPAEYRLPLTIDGDRVDYYVWDGEHRLGSLWRVDLTTDEAVRVVTDVDTFPFRVNETQYLVKRTHGEIDGPQAGGPGYLVHELRDFELVDIFSGESTLVVAQVSGGASLPDEGLVFLDAFNPDPGLWAYPLPINIARSRTPTSGPFRMPEVRDVTYRQ